MRFNAKAYETLFPRETETPVETSESAIETFKVSKPEEETAIEVKEVEENGADNVGESVCE